MGNVKAIHQTASGKNDLFQNTGNGHIMTLNQFIDRIQNKNSTYNNDYYVREDKSGKTPVSKPDSNTKNNLEN